MTIPKFCALCVDDDESIGFCGTGDTADDAFNEFVHGGEFETYLQCDGVWYKNGDDVEVYIYTVVDVRNSDWPEEERNPKWVWCLDRKVETRKAVAAFEV